MIIPLLLGSDGAGVLSAALIYLVVFVALPVMMAAATTVVGVILGLLPVILCGLLVLAVLGVIVGLPVYLLSLLL
jgi:hypothetical protein